MLNSNLTNQNASVHQLQQCLTLAQDVTKHNEAKETYLGLRDRLLSEHPEATPLIDLMWQEILVSRRSAMFWEEMCNVEKKLADRMAESHLQLRQNYLRLVQEQ